LWRIVNRSNREPRAERGAPQAWIPGHFLGQFGASRRHDGKVRIEQLESRLIIARSKRVDCRFA
jgi:hypothetical protein